MPLSSTTTSGLLVHLANFTKLLYDKRALQNARKSSERRIFCPLLTLPFPLLFLLFPLLFLPCLVSFSLQYESELAPLLQAHSELKDELHHIKNSLNNRTPVQS